MVRNESLTNARDPKNAARDAVRSIRQRGWNSARLLLGAVLATAPLSAVTPANAAWPERAIRLVVPMAAGGSSDSTARIIGEQLAKRLGQPVVIDNKPGASGNIGNAEVARSQPDGYTLLLTGGPFSINPSLFKTLPFDTLKDFKAVTQIAATPSVIVTNLSFPAKNLPELLKFAKDSSINFASPGNGSAQHLSMELLKKSAGLAWTHIPYKGGAPAVNDLIGGHVPIMISGFPEVMPFLRAGTIRPIAVTTAKRSPFLPDVPTLMEAGLATSEIAGWNGIHVPAGTPPEIIERLSTEIREILKNPDVRKKLVDLGFEVRGTTPSEFSAFVEGQIERFGEAVRISGAKLD